MELLNFVELFILKQLLKSTMVIDCCEMFSFFDIVIHFKFWDTILCNKSRGCYEHVTCATWLRTNVLDFPQGSQFVYKRFLVLPSRRIEGTSIFLLPSIKNQLSWLELLVSQ